MCRSWRGSARGFRSTAKLPPSTASRNCAARRSWRPICALRYRWSLRALPRKARPWSTASIISTAALSGSRKSCRPAAPPSSASAGRGVVVTARPRLIALDADDLAVISAHVQDARVQTADIVWRQAEKRLVVGMNRLDWEQTLKGETEPRRLIAALRFDRVLSCKSRNINLGAPDTVLDLLGIEFHPADSPGGSAVLMFNGG